MGTPLSHPISMNIAPVPTVTLINKQRCRQNQGSLVSVDYYGHSINVVEDSYDRSPGSSLTARGPSTPGSTHSPLGPRGEVRDQDMRRGDESEQELSSQTRTHNRCQDAILSVPAQYVRNYHETINVSEKIGEHCQGAPDLNSQSVQGRVIAWVNVDLIMHSYQKNVRPQEPVAENLRAQSNQPSKAMDSHCDPTKDKLDFDHSSTGCFNVEVSGGFGTGQFMEQSRCVTDRPASSECYHEPYSRENNNTATEASRLDGESRGFSITSQCAMDVCSAVDGAGHHSYNDGDCQGNMYSFGPLSGVNTTTSICLASIHAGDTSAFSIADDKQENSYDSQVFNAFYPPGLCNTIAFNNDFTQDSMRSDISMNSISSVSACESSPPGNINVFRELSNTSEKTLDEQLSFGGQRAYGVYNDDQELSMGFLPSQHNQASFGGGETMYSLAQDGLTSLGFTTNMVGRSRGANNKRLECIADAQEALAERFDSFQSITQTSLMSSRLEALASIPAQTQASQCLTDITSERKHKDVASSKEPTEDEDVPSRLGPQPPETVPTNFPNHSDHLLFEGDIDTFSNNYMQQGTQGGSGKMTHIVPIEDDTSNENLLSPSSSWPSFAQHPIDDDKRIDGNDNLLPGQRRRSSVKTVRFAEPANDALPILDINDNLQPGQLKRSSPKTVRFSEPANDALSIFDGPNGYKQYYTAFLCCAPEDLQNFGLSFHSQLEDWGFKIFLPPRDLVLTGCNFDNMSRALEERCNGKIIVILSVNYEASEECSFLTSFARVLDPDARKRNIIPVQIDKRVPIKNVLKGLSIIRYNHDYKCGWLKRKLVDAIAA